MEGIGQIFNSFVDSDNSLLELFLTNLEEHQTFWSDTDTDLDSVFSAISKLLASAGTRDRGLRILLHLLPHCPVEIVEEKAEHYVNVCAKICSNRGQVQLIPLAYGVLERLIHKSLVSNHIHKLMVGELPKLLESLVANPDETVLPAALSFLALAMRHCAGTCGVLKSRIEPFLYALVDATDRSIVTRTATCMLLLQQIRGGGQAGNLHKKTWEEYYLRLVDTIQELLNKIFTHTPETFDEEENLQGLKLPPLPQTDNPIQIAQLLFVRAVNLITYLDQAIVGPYPVPKPITPFKALNLILRGLSVSCDAMKRYAVVENVAFGTFLPSIHYALLELLDGLVLALGSNLLMYADMVYEVFPKCLKAAQADRSGKEGSKKSFTRVRAKIYESIQLWCEKLRHSSCIEAVNEPILEQIVRDITPYVGEVTLKIDASGKQRLSGKAKKKLLKEQNAATALNQAHSRGSTVAENIEQLVDTGNEVLCTAALKCLAAMLQSAGYFIKPVTHKLLQEKIVPLCLSLVAHHQPTGLYGNAKTRVALLRAYAALIVNPHHHCPPPLQCAGYIFNTLQTTDTSVEVRSTAAELARTMELVLHPWKETLYFPIDQTALKDALAKKAQHPLTSLIYKTTPSRPQMNGTHPSESSEAEKQQQPEVKKVSPKKPSPKKPSPKKTTTEQDEMDDESDGEINESLAVTEASEESDLAIEITADDEPVGWVEQVSTSSINQTIESSAMETQSAEKESDNINEGVIHRTEEDDEIHVEPTVVAILDSDEEEASIQVHKNRKDNHHGDDDDDDVVEVPINGSIPAKEVEIVKANGKHGPPVSAENGDTASPKKVKLAGDKGVGATSDKAKNIDDLVEEMVAEFVDEP